MTMPTIFRPVGHHPATLQEAFLPHPTRHCGGLGSQDYPRALVVLM